MESAKRSNKGNSTVKQLGNSSHLFCISTDTQCHGSVGFKIHLMCTVDPSTTHKGKPHGCTLNTQQSQSLREGVSFVSIRPPRRSRPPLTKLWVRLYLLDSEFSCSVALPLFAILQCPCPTLPIRPCCLSQGSVTWRLQNRGAWPRCPSLVHVEPQVNPDRPVLRFALAVWWGKTSGEPTRQCLGMGLYHMSRGSDSGPACEGRTVGRTEGDPGSAGERTLLDVVLRASVLVRRCPSQTFMKRPQGLAPRRGLSVGGGGKTSLIPRWQTNCVGQTKNKRCVAEVCGFQWGVGPYCPSHPNTTACVRTTFT